MTQHKRRSSWWYFNVLGLLSGVGLLLCVSMGHSGFLPLGGDAALGVFCIAAGAWNIYKHW